MSLLEKIIAAYPELDGAYRLFTGDPILLQDDNDGQGAYIAVWKYEKPIPEGLKLGK